MVTVHGLGEKTRGEGRGGGRKVERLIAVRDSTKKRNQLEGTTPQLYHRQIKERMVSDTRELDDQEYKPRSKLVQATR